MINGSLLRSQVWDQGHIEGNCCCCVARHAGCSVSCSVSRLVCECSRDNSSTNVMSFRSFQTGHSNDVIYELTEFSVLRGGGSDCVLRLGCLNIRSLAKKFDSLSDLITSKNIDVLSTTGTWHEESSLTLSKLRQYGYLVLDRPRPREGLTLRSLGTNHGDLVVIESSIGLHQLNDGFDPNTFDSLTTQINRGSRHINLLTVYRTGNLQSQFFSEFSDLLGRFVIKSPTLFVTVDFNIHLDKPDDRNCLAFRDLTSSFGLRLVVEGATHDCGGLLDVVLERDDKDKPSTVVDNLETGLSDHQLLLWKISSPPFRHLTDARMVRQWRKLDIDGLERCLLSSPLVDSVAWPSMDVDQRVELHESTLTNALSSSLPVMAPRLYKYRHPWFDAECIA